MTLSRPHPMLPLPLQPKEMLTGLRRTTLACNVPSQTCMVHSDHRTLRPTPRLIVHAFLLDTLATSKLRRKAHATTMVGEAARQARISRCGWLHVDFESHL